MTDIPAAGPDSGSSRTRWIIILVVVLLIVLVVLHLIRSHKTKPATPPQVVRVAQAFKGNMPEVLSELGTVTPVATVTVLPQLSGYLTQVGYKEGQNVRRASSWRRSTRAPTRSTWSRRRRRW